MKCHRNGYFIEVEDKITWAGLYIVLKSVFIGSFSIGTVYDNISRHSAIIKCVLAICAFMPSKFGSCEGSTNHVFGDTFLSEGYNLELFSNCDHKKVHQLEGKACPKELCIQSS
jgi:hypothetical protein